MSKQPNDDQNPKVDIAELEAELQQPPSLAHEAKAEAKAQVNPSKAAKPSNKVAWFAFILAFISLSLIAAGGYFAYQMQSKLEQDKQQWQMQHNTQLQQLQTQLNNQVAKVSSDISNAQQQSLTKVNQSLADNLTAVNNKVAEISGRQPSDWAIAEANYLVRMAGRKLWLENDNQTAQHLLATADMRIAELNNPALIPIRKAIVNDIATLRALPPTRETDIHIALSALIDQLNSLPLNYVEEHHQPMEHHRAPQVSDNIGDWQQNLTSSVTAVLSKMFYINTGVEQGGSEPYKMPRQQWFLRANVKLAWLQAQTAVLSRNQTVYQNALNRSLQWLGHFKQSDDGVKAALATVEGLIKDPITADYPEKLQSQVILERTLRERLATVPTVVGEQRSEKAEQHSEKQGEQKQAVEPQQKQSTQDSQSEQG